MKKIIPALFFLALIFKATPSYSWGSKGHRMVAEIAKKYLDKGIADSVKKYLDTLSFESAATWMDEIRGDHKYDFMKPWHYINVEKDKTYVKSKEENIVTELELAIDLLKNRKNKTKEEITTAIKVIFHLVGDLHQPLHVGYGTDKGGNSIDVTFSTRQTNLHHVWDSDIIDQKKITSADCLAFGAKLKLTEKTSIQKIDVATWMNDSRSFLTNVYDFKDGTIDTTYIDKNTPIIKKQILNAGLRLASILNEAFKG